MGPLVLSCFLPPLPPLSPSIDDDIHEALNDVVCSYCDGDQSAEHGWECGGVPGTAGTVISLSKKLTLTLTWIRMRTLTEYQQ